MATDVGFLGLLTRLGRWSIRFAEVASAYGNIYHPRKFSYRLYPSYPPFLGAGAYRHAETNLHCSRAEYLDMCTI
jgi:hypothetical protein